MAKKYKRSPRAVKVKLERLGLNLAATRLEVSGDLKMPKELPSLEEVLKIVAAAILKASQQRARLIHEVDIIDGQVVSTMDVTLRK